MPVYCGECGNEIPADMEFCPTCGSYRNKAINVDDKGMVVRACPSCGREYNSGDVYCGACGHELPDARPTIALRQRKNASIAIMLALIPGFFNIFGLGHFVLKNYARGMMFLVIGIVIMYINGWQLFSTSFFISVIHIGMYLYQCMDIMHLAYSPEDD